MYVTLMLILVLRNKLGDDTMKHDETFGNRIRILRKKMNLTQLELSLKVEIPKSTLAGYENGIRRPKFEILEKLAEILNTSTDFLIGITDDPQPSKPTKDIRKLLQSSDYHIDGKKLSNEDLAFAIQFIERLAKNQTEEFSKEEIIEENKETNQIKEPMCDQ